MSALSLYDELNKTLDCTEKISHFVDKWLSKVLLPKDEDLEELKRYIDEVKERIEASRDEIYRRERLGSANSWKSIHDDHDGLTFIKQKHLKNWSFIGKGAFSAVFKAKCKGTNVAIKILQPEKIGTGHEETFSIEMNLISMFRHDNIVAFRYKGEIEEHVTIDTWRLRERQQFLVLEYVPDNLTKYVTSRSTHEEKGLPESVAWNFAGQIIRALAYLHDLDVAHRDIKPDNILIYPESRILKLNDFGEAYKKHFKEASNYLSTRYAAPELWSYFNEDQPDDDFVIKQDFTEMFKRADLYSYGNTVAFCVLGMRPWHSDRTDVLNEADWDPTRAKVELPKKRPDGDPLKKLIMNCYENDPDKRPSSAAAVLNEYFTDDANPYESSSFTTEFFTFGFLKDTKIYIADSLIEETDAVGNTNMKRRYSPDKLVCKVKVERDETLPEPSSEWEHYEFYCSKMREFNSLFESGEIKKDTSVALKSLRLPLRHGKDNCSITLEFTETSYVHHRAMRAVWREVMNSEEKLKAVPCKRIVNSFYSTSFGLHLAVITSDKKILFFQRENAGTNPSQAGLPAPRLFTCTVTKSVYKESYNDRGEGMLVSLLHSAAFCLHEELGISLTEQEQEAFHFHTVYLKFDNHEWGICAYIDLADHRIAEPRRLSSDQIKTRYTEAKKTKHNSLFSVSFEPYAVASFLRKNLLEMASSTKMVTVKTLKAFYEKATVEDAFKEK